MLNQEQNLKRDLGFWPAISLVVGVVIGSGVFVKPGTVLDYVGGNTSMALLAWLLTGLLTLAAGLTIAELCARIPKTGGLYIYLEEVYGRFSGFISGWVQNVIYQPALIGAMGLYFGILVASYFKLGGSWHLYIGMGTVIFLAVVNSLGVKYGGMIQVVTTAAKLIPIVLIAVFGLMYGSGDIFSASTAGGSKEGLGAAMLAAMFAYDGWIASASAAGEMRNPAKILPKAISIGLLVIIVSYLAVNMALIHIMPASQIQALGENAAGTAAGILFGEAGHQLIDIGIIISIFGGLNGKILSYPRISFAMANDRLLPGARFLSCVHAKFGTPVWAIAFQIVLAILFMVLSNPDRLSEIAIFAIFIFYIQAFVAIFLLRKRKPEWIKQKENYRVPFYPVTPILAIIGSVFVVLSMLTHDLEGAVITIIITLAGLPIYWWMNRKQEVSA
ncbi:APC family permease [Thermoactinomyces mirandus]|uniref:APC family permease n=1 Tax=Thermoactinomyces mirandus TaxID=2756294 RepID=A0A7W1XTD5_9BACL|nr:APC family permease [Thermoactinomyces mirandus]MBA4602836.1 APC family permease [Thermoactinomyces mirandus]